MTTILHVLAGCPFSEFCILTAEASRTDVKIQPVPTREYLKSPEFLKINPAGGAPVLETPEGIITESFAIVNYIARRNPASGLQGKSNWEHAEIEQHILNSANLRGSVAPLYLRMMGIRPPGPSEENTKQKELVEQELEKLNEKLNLKTYLVGHQVTLADIAYIPALKKIFNYVLIESERNKFKNVARYFRHLTTLPLNTKIFGDNFKYCTKPYPFLTKEQYELSAPGAPAPVKATKPKEEKPKKEQKPKVESEPIKKEAVTKTEVPTSSFSLYNFKTELVNSTDVAATCDSLFTRHDANAFSFWHGVYDKLPTECQDFTRTANLITNFCKNVEPIGKKLIGTWGIYGDEPDLNCEGVLYWNNPDFLTEFKEHPTCEYIKWTKLNPTIQKDQDLIKQFWANRTEEQKVNGATVLKVKWLK